MRHIHDAIFFESLHITIPNTLIENCYISHGRPKWYQLRHWWRMYRWVLKHIRYIGYP